MRDHDSGKTLTFGADDLDRIMHGLLSGDRDALILADEINKRWRAAPLPTLREPTTVWAPCRICSVTVYTCRDTNARTGHPCCHGCDHQVNR